MRFVFESNSFTFWNVAFAAIGAAALWGKQGRTELKAYVLSDIVRLFLKGRLRILVEFLIFVVLGCLVGIAVVEPTNARQAITAGFAWTAVFARH